MPEILTFIPQAARAGARTRLTLSPTPPVLCLSTTRPSQAAGHDKHSPDLIMAAVKSMVSRSDSPRMKTAISHAPAAQDSRFIGLQEISHLHYHREDFIFCYHFVIYQPARNHGPYSGWDLESLRETRVGTWKRYLQDTQAVASLTQSYTPLPPLLHTRVHHVENTQQLFKISSFPHL